MDGSVETERWKSRVDTLWARCDALDAASFVARMERLVAERAPDDPLAAYEMGSAFDSTGSPELAVTHYRRALTLGLSEAYRIQATIQLASSLRNLGEFAESVTLLAAERARGSSEYDDAIAGFLALALSSAGREREAVSIALAQLATHMTRYRRSLSNYAVEIVTSSPRSTA